MEAPDGELEGANPLFSPPGAGDELGENWISEYGYLGVSSRVAGGRKSTAANPWNEVKPAAARAKRRPSQHIAQTLDTAARQELWYCLDLQRDDAVALLENREVTLPNGAFVISGAGKDFATLSLLHKKNLHNVPIASDPTHKSLFLRGAELTKPPMFKTLSEMVAFYAKKKQKGLPCKLAPAALVPAPLPGEGHAIRARKDSVLVGRGTGLDNPSYTSASPRAGMSNPHYQGEQTGIRPRVDSVIAPTPSYGTKAFVGSDGAAADPGAYIHVDGRGPLAQAPHAQASLVAPTMPYLNVGASGAPLAGGAGLYIDGGGSMGMGLQGYSMVAAAGPESENDGFVSFFSSDAPHFSHPSTRADQPCGGSPRGATIDSDAMLVY